MYNINKEAFYITTCKYVNNTYDDISTLTVHVDEIENTINLMMSDRTRIKTNIPDNRVESYVQNIDGINNYLFITDFDGLCKLLVALGRGTIC